MQVHIHDRWLQVSVIVTETEFLSLKEEWNRLADNTLPISVFFRHEWFQSAWQWIKHVSEPIILSVKDGDHLVGLCPLLRISKKFHGFTYTCLEFLSVPDAQTCGILAGPEDLMLVCEAIAKQLSDWKRAWDALELNKLDIRYPAAENLMCSLKKVGIRCFLDSAGGNPFFNMTECWDAYYSRRSRRLKKAINNISNKIVGSFSKIEVRHLQSQNVTPSQLDKFLQTAIDISSLSWKASKGVSLDQTGPLEFIRMLTFHAHKHGWLSLWLLYLDNNPVAMEYQLNDGKIIYALRSDYNESYAAHSPGTFLNRRIMEAMFEGTSSTYFMGPGDNPYKLRWAEGCQQLQALVGYNSTARGILLYLLQKKIAPIFRHTVKLGNRSQAGAGATMMKISDSGEFGGAECHTVVTLGDSS